MKKEKIEKNNKLKKMKNEIKKIENNRLKEMIEIIETNFHLLGEFSTAQYYSMLILKELVKREINKK